MTAGGVQAGAGRMQRGGALAAQPLERARALVGAGADADRIKEELSHFFQKLAKSNNTDCSRWLDTLEIIITSFPKNCLTHRNTIENYLVQFLDSSNESWVIGAAKCCHALQQVRPSNDKTATAKSSWRQQMSLLCSTAHSLMGAAFTNAVDIYKDRGYFQIAESATTEMKTPISTALTQLATNLQRVSEEDKFEHATLSPLMKNTLLCNRLRNVFTFMQAMMVEVYPVAKPVRPQMILDATVRALSVTSGANQMPVKNADQVTLGANIAIVKTQALRTLDALIVCLGSNLIPYSPLVFRLVTQALRWSLEHHTQESRQVRCRAYDTLSHWLTTLHCHKLDAELNRSKGKCLEDELLGSMLDDITPHRQVIALTMSNQSTKNLSKKARRKLANNQLSKSGIAHHIPGAVEKNKDVDLEENAAVVISALNCLEVLLATSGIFLKPTSHKKVQECLVRQCYSLEEFDVSRGLALCRALEACRLSVPPNVPPPTQHCLHVYSAQATSAHREISQSCSIALHSVRLSLHSAPPTLTFSLERALETSNKLDKPTATVSERNRAALASLLGVENYPSPAKSDEVITIQDESISRKRKAEECIEQITLDSDNSVEVEIDSTNGIDLDSADEDFNGEIQEVDVILESSLRDDGDVNVNNLDITNHRVDELSMRSSQSKINKDTTKNIHEMATQIPQNLSNDTVNSSDESNHSVEISYDCRRDEIVKALEKMDGDNLPSTNETDDIQITCGQMLKSSQESGIYKKAQDAGDKIINIDDEDDKMDLDVVCVDVAAKEVNTDSAKNGAVTVEEMLADFVDEVA